VAVHAAPRAASRHDARPFGPVTRGLHAGFDFRALLPGASPLRLLGGLTLRRARCSPGVHDVCYSMPRTPRLGPKTSAPPTSVVMCVLGRRPKPLPVSAHAATPRSLDSERGGLTNPVRETADSSVGLPLQRPLGWGVGPLWLMVSPRVRQSRRRDCGALFERCPILAALSQSRSGPEPGRSLFR